MDRENKNDLKRLLAGMMLILIAVVLIYMVYKIFFDESTDIGTVAIGFNGLLIVGPVLLWLMLWSMKRMLQKGEENRSEMEEAIQRMQAAPEDVPAEDFVEEVTETAAEELPGEQ
ncbi:MAG: hypothetical protein IK016_09595 [Lachnospiraceae bacterium]|nr:hypothetical protein [Lachnospiraceae bacterium]